MTENQAQDDVDPRPALTTRQRILVAALLLFNENGEPNTTTNEISDELDISPGNLHYHFRRKSDLVDALIDEFDVDAKGLFVYPDDGDLTIEDLWFFLHLLVECTSGYRFLFRDLETLIAVYPGARKYIRTLVDRLTRVLAAYLERLEASGVVDYRSSNRQHACRSILLVVLFGEQFAAIVNQDEVSGDVPTRTAAHVLQSLLPFLSDDAGATILLLLEQYE